MLAKLSRVRNFISYGSLSCAKCVPQSSQPGDERPGSPTVGGRLFVNAMILVGQASRLLSSSRALWYSYKTIGTATHGYTEPHHQSPKAQPGARVVRRGTDLQGGVAGGGFDRRLSAGPPAGDQRQDFRGVRYR